MIKLESSKNHDHNHKEKTTKPDSGKKEQSHHHHDKKQQKKVEIKKDEEDDLLILYELNLDDEINIRDEVEDNKVNEKEFNQKAHHETKAPGINHTNTSFNAYNNLHHTLTPTARQNHKTTFIVDLNDQKNQKEIFNDYDFKVDHTEKKKLDVANRDEKKINALSNLKNSLFKKLKQKNKEIILRNYEKQYQHSIKEHGNKDKYEIHSPNTYEFSHDHYYLGKQSSNTLMNRKKKLNVNQKLSKKQMVKQKKRMERYLKIKKYKKQLKKKTKKDEVFLKAKTYQKKNKISSYPDTDEWKIVLEEQLKRVFPQKDLGVNYFIKTLINKMENVKFVDVNEEKITSNLSKLETFDDLQIKDDKRKKSNNKLLDSAVKAISANTSFASRIAAKEKMKIDKLNELKNKLLDIKSREDYLQETRKVFKDTIENLDNFEKIEHKKNSNVPDIIVVEDCKSTNKVNLKEMKLSNIDKLKVKQRMINFSMSVYDKFDLKKIIVFWKNNKDNHEWIRRNLKNKEVNKTLEETKNGKLQPNKQEDTKAKEEKKKTKAEIHVKQNYAQPNSLIKNLIPYCNNIYTIQKNES